MALPLAPPPARGQLLQLPAHRSTSCGRLVCWPPASTAASANNLRPRRSRPTKPDTGSIIALRINVHAPLSAFVVRSQAPKSHTNAHDSRPLAYRPHPVTTTSARANYPHRRIQVTDGRSSACRLMLQLHAKCAIIAHRPINRLHLATVARLGRLIGRPCLSYSVCVRRGSHVVITTSYCPWAQRWKNHYAPKLLAKYCEC